MTASNPSLSWWLSIAGEWKHDLNNKGLAETSALLEADILIVGAGISGASLALALREARPHLKVCGDLLSKQLSIVGHPIQAPGSRLAQVSWLS
jgi:ribulose 1,5-bisphosphate synthetase/thiazole synthase